jgi:predicted transcriptional regulator
MLLEMEKQDPYAAELTEEERADLREALAEAERGEFATDEEVEAVFARYRR